MGIWPFPMTSSEIPFILSTTLKLNPLRRCWVEIDLSALRHNARALRELSPRQNLMAVIKADAYGHGLERVAEALCDDVEWFCVANVNEALRLRAALKATCRPILLLSPITPDECETVVANDFSSSVSSVEEIREFQQVAGRLGKTANLHAVADTGMGRMGACPADWQELVEAILESPDCHLEGVATHFPNADEDTEFTRKQIRSFRDLIAGLDCEVHLSNSAGIIDFSAQIDFATLARPGLALYGISPDCDKNVDLKPVMTLKSRVTLVRSVPAGTTISYGSTFTAGQPMKTASIAVGYGDGYPRHLSGQGAEVVIDGSRCPVLGRVTMDQIVVDVSHLETVKSGDEVVLMGEEVPATELAEKSGTIPWEILTGITSRAERVYFD